MNALTKFPEMTGLEQLHAIFDGSAGYNGIVHTMKLKPVSAEEGLVIFEGNPDASVYNPIGSVHGGYAATMLDTVMGCAVHSRMKQGQGYTTLELKVSYHKAMTDKSGPVRAEGRVISVGRRAAFAEGKLFDKNGALLRDSHDNLFGVCPMSTTFDAAIPVRPTFGNRLQALPKRALIVGGLALIIAVAGILWILSPASSVATDDAYVKADSTIVAPKVSGLIGQIYVQENQRVKVGQPLIRIDPEDYQQAVSAAQADLQSAQAALDAQVAQQALAHANSGAAKASILAADAERTRAAADRLRFEKLVADGDISHQQADQARATSLSADADSQKSRAALIASQQQESVVAQTRGQLLAALAKARASLSLARQNLDHTIIRAAVEGVVGDRQAQTGEYVQPGTQLMTIVPLDKVYVVANFKESQTARMLTGQKVRVNFDALPNDTFDGTVESFAPGSGSEFSLLPFEPATGNFTRIVQRVPTRIRLSPGQADASRLRPGLSAYVTVLLH